jgi:hypothetical protein
VKILALTQVIITQRKNKEKILGKKIPLKLAIAENKTTQKAS